MHTALVHRRPWAGIQWNSAEAQELPTFRVECLDELLARVVEFNASAR
jgi:hypothetical protein